MPPAPSSQDLGVPDTPADRPRVSFLSRGWGCDVPALEGNSRMAWAEAATPPPSRARVTRGPTCSFPPALLWAGSRRGRPHRQPGSSAWRHMCVDVCSPCGRPVCACCRVCGLSAKPCTCLLPGPGPPPGLSLRVCAVGEGGVGMAPGLPPGLGALGMCLAGVPSPGLTTAPQTGYLLDA